MEKKLSKNKMLDIFSSLIARSLVSVGGKGEAREQIWPAPMVSLIEAVYYTMKYYPKFFLELVKKLESKGYSDIQIAKLLKYPSRTAQNLWATQGKGVGQMSKEELTEYTVKTLRYISLLRKSDLFCRDGKNIIWPNNIVRTELNGAQFIDVRESELTEVISKLHAALWLHTELLYFASHAVGHEFHGPYKLKSKILLVREYFDLRNIEIWPFTSELSFNYVKILEIYDKKLNIKFDIFNRIKSQTSIPEYLKKLCLVVDGNRITKRDEIENLLKELKNIAEIGSKSILKMNKEKLIEKVNEASHFWVAKPLADELGLDWHPPKEMSEDIKNNEAVNSEVLKNFIEGAKKFPQLAEKQKIGIFKNLFDPRK